MDLEGDHMVHSTAPLLRDPCGCRKSQPTASYELWTFALINGRSRITSFTYNLRRTVSNGG